MMTMLFARAMAAAALPTMLLAAPVSAHTGEGGAGGFLAGFAHPLLRGQQSFDLVTANILPRPLIALAPAMRRALRPGGIAVLSGLLNHQAHQVRARYHAAGFRLLSGRRHAGWTVLALQRR